MKKTVPTWGVVLFGLYTAFCLTWAASQWGIVSASFPPESPSLRAGEIFRLVNEYRASQGIKPLIWEPTLAIAAKDKAAQMSRLKQAEHYLEGKGPDYWIEKSGAFRKIIGTYGDEDLTFGYLTAPDVLAGWQSSPPHNKSILNPCSHWGGIGVSGGYVALHMLGDENCNP